MTTFNVKPGESGGKFKIEVGGRSGPYLPRETFGAQVAHGTIPAGSASGTSIVWTADAAGYTAENGLPGDRDPNLLRLPKRWPRSVSGVVIEAEADDAIYGRVRLSEGEYVNLTPVQLDPAGEWLSLSCKRNPSGGDGAGDWLECIVSAGGDDLTNEVTIRVYESTSSPAIGVTQTQYDALSAHVTAHDEAILELEQGDHSGTNAPLATDAEVDAPDTGHSIRSFTTSLAARLVRAVVTLPFITRLLGGALRDASVTGNTLTIHGYDENGNPTNTHFTPPQGPGGGGGITLEQAAALFNNPPFVVDMGPPIRITYTHPLPANNTIARAMLTQALRDAIDSLSLIHI